jgi:hypothetical protein
VANMGEKTSNNESGSFKKNLMPIGVMGRP